MKRINKKEIRVNLLVLAGWNMEKDYFTLSLAQLSDLEVCRKLDGYNYKSPLGRGVLRSYWYSLQRAYNRMNKASK